MFSAIMARATTSSQSSALCTQNKFDNDENEEEEENLPNQMTLHHNLSTSNWSTALKSLHQNPISASTWIINRHGRMLPLHAALLYGAPSHVILELLHTYPEAAKEPDLQGRLPIHIAASMAAIVSFDDDEEDEDGGREERILNELVRVYPESMWIADEGGRTAMELVEIVQVMQRQEKEEEEQLKREVDSSLKASVVEEDCENKKPKVSSGKQRPYRDQGCRCGHSAAA